MLKTIVRTVALIMLVGILLFKVTRNRISIGVGSSDACTNDTHCYYTGAITLNDKNILSLTTAGDANLHNVSIEGKATIAGALQAITGSFGSLLGHGATTLSSIDIKNHAHINGELKASKGTYGSLSAYGGATLSSITITNDTTSAGIFNATNSTFNSLSAWRGSLIMLTNSTVNSITITNKSQTNIPHPITLDATTVGNITFEEKDGIVVLRNGSVIKGEVIGGTVINE